MLQMTFHYSNDLPNVTSVGELMQIVNEISGYLSDLEENVFCSIVFGYKWIMNNEGSK